MDHSEITRLKTELAEAVGLLTYCAEWCVSAKAENKARDFVARHAQAEQQEAPCDQDGGFWTWLALAYRDSSKGEGRKFTKHNMEAAYRSGAKAARAALSTQPAAGTTSDQYRAELYDEVWQKARDMGYGNVTDALVALERMKATQPADGEPVAWIVESPKDLEPVTSVCKRKDQADRFKSMRWTVTPVYAAPPAAAHGDDTRRIDWLACKWRLGGTLPDVDHGSFREVIDAAMRAQGDGEVQ